MSYETAKSFYAEFFGGSHRIPHTSKIEEWGNGWQLSFRGEMATFDGSELTRLVLMGHRDAVRVSLSARSVGRIRVAIHQREREGSMYDRHPDIETAVKSLNY